MSAPKIPKYDVDPVIHYEGKDYLHMDYKSMFNDIFRKMDLQLNGQLSAKEINQFGELFDNEFFQDVTEDSLEGPDFSTIS